MGCVFQLQHLAARQRGLGDFKLMHESIHMCTNHYTHAHTRTQMFDQNK